MFVVPIPLVQICKGVIKCSILQRLVTPTYLGTKIVKTFNCIRPVNNVWRP